MGVERRSRILREAASHRPPVRARGRAIRELHAPYTSHAHRDTCRPLDSRQRAGTSAQVAVSATKRHSASEQFREHSSYFSGPQRISPMELIFVFLTFELLRIDLFLYRLRIFFCDFACD